MIIWLSDCATPSYLRDYTELDSDLDLKKALAMARNSEAVRTQQTTVRGSTRTPATSDLAALHKTAPLDKKHGQRQRTRKPGQMTTGSTGLPQQAKTCSWCGRETHPRPRCPARDATCALCKNRGHFAAVCKSRPHQSMEAIVDDSGDSSAFLSSSRYIVGVDKEDFHRRHSSHYESGHWS